MHCSNIVCNAFSLNELRNSRTVSQEENEKNFLPQKTCSKPNSTVYYKQVATCKSHQMCLVSLDAITFISMTSLLAHIVAHSTRHSFRHKTNNQPFKKFLSLAVS